MNIPWYIYALIASVFVAVVALGAFTYASLISNKALEHWEPWRFPLVFIAVVSAFMVPNLIGAYLYHWFR